MRKVKIAVALLVPALIASYFLFDIGQYLSLDFIQEKHQLFSEYAAENRIKSMTYFFILYLVASILAVPGISILSLGAGAVFGFTTACILVSFSSTLGATLAFLLSRYLFRDIVQRNFPAHIQDKLNTGIEKEGAFYLFTLRLFPVIPFFLINMLMGLTAIKTPVFYLVSQAGMFPISAVVTYSGNQLSKVESLGDVLSPSILIALGFLGVFPIAAKKLVELCRRRRSSLR